MKTVPDPRLAIDGDADGDEIRNIAVDRPLGDLKLLGDSSRRLDTVASKQQDNLEKAISASPGTSVLRTSCQRNGNNMLDDRQNTLPADRRVSGGPV